jgi:uncharacterized RDD family membrane protein YckC
MTTKSVNNFQIQNVELQLQLQGVPLASFRSRAAAFLIDLIIVGLLFLLSDILQGTAQVRFGGDSSLSFEFGDLMSFVVMVAYFGLATFVGKGATVGKKLLGIRVVSLVHSHMSLWHSIERALGYAASSLEAGFGFLQYFTHPNNQTVHDRIAETIVISTRTRRQEETGNKNTQTKKWGAAEKTAWLTEQKIQRSYFDDVIQKIDSLRKKFHVEQYGALSFNPEKYPLFVVKNKEWSNDKKIILVTGGVHGYETSGVQGALRFLEVEAESYAKKFNIVVVPCVSPWGYETINRWNPYALDPNRSFKKTGEAEEAIALMKMIDSLKANAAPSQFIAHIDLHETTDTDNTIFRPALEARDGITEELWEIPDGFYLVGDTENPQHDFQRAIIESVQQVTHIAPTDKDGRIIGEKVSQTGVINYAAKNVGLCAGYSQCAYTTTTEVYPDSPKVNSENCILAQVAAVKGGLDYLIKKQR